MNDMRGNPIEIGDTVLVVGYGLGGAEQWMEKGKVVGFGRTRVRIDFASDIRPYIAVHPDFLRVVEKGGDTDAVHYPLQDVGRTHMGGRQVVR